MQVPRCWFAGDKSMTMACVACACQTQPGQAQQDRQESHSKGFFYAVFVSLQWPQHGEGEDLTSFCLTSKHCSSRPAKDSQGSWQHSPMTC